MSTKMLDINKADIIVAGSKRLGLTSTNIGMVMCTTAYILFVLQFSSSAYSLYIRHGKQSRFRYVMQLIQWMSGWCEQCFCSVQSTSEAAAAAKNEYIEIKSRKRAFSSIR